MRRRTRFALGGATAVGAVLAPSTAAFAGGLDPMGPTGIPEPGMGGPTLPGISPAFDTRAIEDFLFDYRIDRLAVCKGCHGG